MDQGRRKLITLVVAIAVMLLVVVAVLLFWNYPANAAPKPSPSPSPSPTPEEHLNLWSYDGYRDLVKGPSKACWDGGCTYSYTRAYGRFHYCVTWYCQYAHPWGAITARGDGTSTIGSGV